MTNEEAKARNAFLYRCVRCNAVGQPIALKMERQWDHEDAWARDYVDSGLVMTEHHPPVGWAIVTISHINPPFLRMVTKGPLYYCSECYREIRFEDEF